MSSRAIDLSAAGYGLRTERQLHINRILMDATGGKLTLRRIPEADPAFRMGMQSDPPKIFGVHEAGVASNLSPWVFTLAEMSIDERIVARALAGDFSRHSAAEQMSKVQAFEAANRASKLKIEAERLAEREDEMVSIGRLAGKKHSFRHRISGEDFIIGDTVRPVGRNILR